MKTMSKFAPAISAFALLILANGGAVWAAPPPNACSLLTAAQVSAVLGIPPEPGHGFMDGKFCLWGAGKKIGVLLTLMNPQLFAAAKTPVGHGNVKVPAGGIGDDAVYGTTPGFPTILTVKKGELVFAVHVKGFPDDQIKAKEKALALDILKKL